MRHDRREIRIVLCLQVYLLTLQVRDQSPTLLIVTHKVDHDHSSKSVRLRRRRIFFLIHAIFFLCLLSVRALTDYKAGRPRVGDHRSHLNSFTLAPRCVAPALYSVDFKVHYSFKVLLGTIFPFLSYFFVKKIVLLNFFS